VFRKQEAKREQNGENKACRAEIRERNTLTLGGTANDKITESRE
jgi:hypothetical protein